MFDIFYQSDRGFIYSSAVWETLRRDYRIVGTFVGSTLKTPSLPLELLPEEVVLLVNRGVCRLLKSSHNKYTSQNLEKEYAHFKESLLKAEQLVYKESRRDDLEIIIDTVIEGKKKKGVVTNQSREELLQEELNKSCTIQDSTLIWPIFTMSPFEYEINDVCLTNILRQTTSTKYEVFKDLWDKGYYITSGAKFGSDFLIYLGDPILYHAVYIVRCIENPDAKQHTSEIIAFGRLGSSVKKRLGKFRNCAVVNCRDKMRHRHMFPNSHKQRVRFQNWIKACGNPLLLTCDADLVYKVHL